MRALARPEAARGTSECRPHDPRRAGLPARSRGTGRRTRVLLAQGQPTLGTCDAAWTGCTRLLAAQDRTGSLIQIGALRALALAASGQEAAAGGPALAGALTLASPQGYVRVFTDEGPPMVCCSAGGSRPSGPNTPVARRVPLGCLTRLQQAFDAEHPVPDHGGGPLPRKGIIEPLTRRELEVLGMLAAGRSNLAIADQLVVTLDTVSEPRQPCPGQTRRGRPAPEPIPRAQQLGLIPSRVPCIPWPERCRVAGVSWGSVPGRRMGHPLGFGAFCCLGRGPLGGGGVCRSMICLGAGMASWASRSVWALVSSVRWRKVPAGPVNVRPADGRGGGGRRGEVPPAVVSMIQMSSSASRLRILLTGSQGGWDPWIGLVVRPLAGGARGGDRQHADVRHRDVAGRSMGRRGRAASAVHFGDVLAAARPAASRSWIAATDSSGSTMVSSGLIWAAAIISSPLARAWPRSSERSQCRLMLNPSTPTLLPMRRRAGGSGA